MLSTRVERVSALDILAAPYFAPVAGFVVIFPKYLA